MKDNHVIPDQMISQTSSLIYQARQWHPTGEKPEKSESIQDGGGKIVNGDIAKCL